MIALLIAASSLIASDGSTYSSQDQLRFLAATQEQTELAYSKLSFDAKVLSTSFVSELGKSLSVDSNYCVTTCSGTTLITWECHTSLLRTGEGAGRIEVVKDPRVKRVLRGSKYIVAWSQIDSPEASVHFLADWQSSMKYYAHDFKTLHTGVDIIGRCLGHRTSFRTIYEKENSRAHWQVPVFDAESAIEVHRELPKKDGEYKLDLKFVFHPKDGLMQKAEFKPVMSKTDIVSTSQVEYATLSSGINDLRVPSKYLYRQSGGQKELDEELRIDFTNFVDRSGEPELTLTDMGLPIGALVHRVFPDNRVETLVWSGSEIVFEQDRRLR